MIIKAMLMYWNWCKGNNEYDNNGNTNNNDHNENSNCGDNDDKDDDEKRKSIETRKGQIRL